MSAAHSSSRSRRGPRAAKRTSTNRFPVFVIAALAVVVVAGAIGIQTLKSEADAVPPRIATGQGRVLGNEDAPVTIIEYADFQCPVCKRATSSIISQIERDYVVSGQVKIEFRMFPFLGPESFNAAQAAEAAREQGKFWEYHDALFNAQGRENSGVFTYEKLVDIARDLGLAIARFEVTLSSNMYLDAIQREADEARDAGVASTPTFYVNDEKIMGAQPYDRFKSAIDRALAISEEAQ